MLFHFVIKQIKARTFYSIASEALQFVRLVNFVKSILFLIYFAVACTQLNLYTKKLKLFNFVYASVVQLRQTKYASKRHRSNSIRETFIFTQINFFC